MSDLLALQWDKDRVHGVQAHVTPAQVRIARCFTIERPAELDLAEPKQTGKWLKEQLDALQIRADATLVTMPRDAAVVKRLELPSVADEELPVLVRFQAGAKSSLPITDLALDFVPLPQQEPNAARQVLTAVVPRQVLEGLQAVCREAGLKMVSLGFAPIGLLELVCRNRQSSGQMSDGTILVLSRQGNRAEIIVAQGAHLLSSHAFRLGDDAPDQHQQTILTEVSRTLISLNTGTKIEQAWILADPDHRGTLPAALSKRLGCEVQIVDPFIDTTSSGHGTNRPASAESFAGPIGALLARQKPHASGLDFLNPRQPPVKRDRRKAQIALYGGVAAGIALLLGGWYIQFLSRLNANAEKFADADRKLAQYLKTGEPVRKSAELVEQWLAGDAFLLDELLELTQHMPSTDRIFLKKLDFDPPTAPYIAKIKAVGLARDRNDVMRVDERAITDRERYKVLPNAIVPDKENESYPWRFETEVLIKQLDAKPASKTGATASAASKSDAPSNALPAKTETPQPEEQKDSVARPADKSEGAPTKSDEKPVATPADSSSSVTPIAPKEAQVLVAQSGDEDTPRNGDSDGADDAGELSEEGP